MSCYDSSYIPVGTDPELILAFYLQQIGNLVEDGAYIQVTNGHCLLLRRLPRFRHVPERIDNLFGAEAAIDRSGCFYPH
jgi:hypothetical protein